MWRGRREDACLVPACAVCQQVVEMSNGSAVLCLVLLGMVVVLAQYARGLVFACAVAAFKMGGTGGF